MSMPSTLEIVNRLHVQFLGKEGIWAIGLGQGVIYVFSSLELSQEQKAMMMAMAFPVGFETVLGYPPAPGV